MSNILCTDEFIEGYVSPITQEPHGAFQTLRIGTFPDYLIIQIQRFAHTETFDVKKLDVDVEIEEKIDLSMYSSSGAKPGEDLLPDDGEPNEKVNELMQLGFTPHQAKYALKMTKGDANQAAEWLFMNADEVPAEDLNGIRNEKLAPKEVRNGSGQYQLTAFISHMGSSPHSGHYVAHIKKDDVWYIFNDEKVAISQNPPKLLGYLYLFKRCTS